MGWIVQGWKCNEKDFEESLPELHIDPESHLGSNLVEKIKTYLLLEISSASIDYT